MLDSPRAQRYHSGAGQARAAEDGMAYDLLIRNGMIVDGTGFSRYQADVAIQDGTIAEIGRVRGAATRTIDAEGLFVAPGIIDLHTHYDVQPFWDRLCTSQWVGRSMMRSEEHTSELQSRSE